MELELPIPKFFLYTIKNIYPMKYISTMSTESRCLRPNRALLIFLIYHQHGISGKGHPSTPLLHIRQRRRDSKSHHKTLFFTTSFASSCRRLSFARRRTQQLQLRQHELGDQQMTKRVAPKINQNIGFFLNGMNQRKLFFIF